MSLETMRLENRFRELRDAWFNQHLKSYSHERMWEEEAAARLREKQNAQLKEKYDEQTEQIIEGVGDVVNVAPSCGANMR